MPCVRHGMWAPEGVRELRTARNRLMLEFIMYRYERESIVELKPIATILFARNGDRQLIGCRVLFVEFDKYFETEIRRSVGLYLFCGFLTLGLGTSFFVPV